MLEDIDTYELFFNGEATGFKTSIKKALMSDDFDYPDQMFDDIKKAHEKAVSEINADGIIPCGEVMLKLLKSGIEKIHRDTFHAELGIGRYALIWYTYLTEKNRLV